MKQFAAWFTHGIPNGSSLRKSIFEARSGPAVLAAVETFFANRASQPQQETEITKQELFASTAAYCD